MRLYGLIGRTLGHSFSAAYFADKFRRENIDATYHNFQLTDIKELTRLISEIPNLQGLNVTIPYKQAVIPLLDELDGAAAAIGAVNTIVISRNNGHVRLKGFNTDAPGFLESVRPILPPVPTQALLLGSGGASLAVRHALESIGITCTHVSRTPAPGILSYADINGRVMREHRLIVNCTPLGTHPDTKSCPPIPYSLVGTGHLAHDLVYNPGCTEFMQRCAAQGATVRNGLKMLHSQAEKSWLLWNDTL